MGDDHLDSSDWNECISEYLAEPKDLMNNLFEFAKEYDEFEDNMTIVEIIENHLKKDHLQHKMAWGLGVPKVDQEELYEINS